MILIKGYLDEVPKTYRINQESAQSWTWTHAGRPGLSLVVSANQPSGSNLWYKLRGRVMADPALFSSMLRDAPPKTDL